MKAEANIILVGMMGAGKTTVGRVLARRTKRPYFDSDEEIERRCGVRVPVVFEIEGERGFRSREKQVIADLCAAGGSVIATGGGAVLDPDNRRRLSTSGTVIYLHAKPSQLWHRVRHDRNRPLLASGDPQKKLEELYAQRDPLYREVAAIVVETGRQSVQTLAKDLIARLDAACRLSA